VFLFYKRKTPIIKYTINYKNIYNKNNCYVVGNNNSPTFNKRALEVINMVKIERVSAIFVIATILVTTFGASFTVTADSVACVWVTVLKEGTNKPIINADVLGDDINNYDVFEGMYLPDYKIYLLEAIPLKGSERRSIEVRATVGYVTKKETIQVCEYDGIDIYYVNFSFPVSRSKNIMKPYLELLFKIYVRFPILMLMFRLPVLNRL